MYLNKYFTISKFNPLFEIRKKYGLLLTCISGPIGHIYVGRTEIHVRDPVDPFMYGALCIVGAPGQLALWIRGHWGDSPAQVGMFSNSAYNLNSPKEV